MKPCLNGIYFLIKNGKCVYVGQSNDIYRRISEHRTGTPKRKGAPKDFDSWEYLEEPSQERKDQLEHLLIRILDPELNIDPHSCGYIKHIDERLDFIREAVGQANSVIRFVQRMDELEMQLKTYDAMAKFEDYMKNL